MRHEAGKIGKVHVHARLWEKLKDQECFAFPRRAAAWAQRLLENIAWDGGTIHFVDHHAVVAYPIVDEFCLGRQARFLSFMGRCSVALSAFDKKMAPGDRVRSRHNGWRGLVEGVGLAGEVLMRLTHDRYGRPLRKPVRYHVSIRSFDGDPPAWTVEKLLT